MTREQVKDYLNNLAKEVAENRTFTATGQVNKSKMNKATFINRLLTEEKVDMYEVMTGAPKTIKVDGKECKVIIEAANEDKLNSFAKGSSATEVECAIAVDDQYFWDGVSSEVTVPVQLVYEESASKPAETVYWTLPYASDIDDIDDEFNAAVDAKLAELEYPMFVLTIENTVEDVEMDKMNKVTAGPYLAFKGVRLKVERDGFTNEEFEMWYSYDYSNYISNHWRFNGHHRNDASGAYKYFNDVNKKHKWYEKDNVNDMIMLTSFNSFNQMIVPWEDDCNEGLLDRSTGSGNYDPNFNFWYENKLYYDAYNCGSNNVDDNIWMKSAITGTRFASDQDDSYSEAGFYMLNYNNLRTQTNNGTIYLNTDNAINHGLDDIAYKFTLKY